MRYRCRCRSAVLELSTSGCAAQQPPYGGLFFINELHYDNFGADEGEFFEIAAPAGTDLTGWSVVLYNGSNGTAYNTIALNGAVIDAGSGYGFVAESLPVNGLQNGAPDGLALVNSSGTVVQFLSYEGVITANDGPAVGQTSTDIGIAEPGAIGESLQLVGAGATAADFSWSGPIPSTLGTANTDQTFVVTGDAPPQLNEFSVNTTGADVEYFEIAGTAGTDYSAWTVLEIQGIVEELDTPGQIIDAFPMGTTDANGLFVANLEANTVENDPARCDRR